MITWTPTVLSVLFACVSYFCICTCSVQLSMFHMERRSRNTLIIIIIININNTSTNTSNNNNNRIEMRNMRFFKISVLRCEPSSTRTFN